MSVGPVSSDIYLTADQAYQIYLSAVELQTDEKAFKEKKVQEIVSYEVNKILAKVYFLSEKGDCTDLIYTIGCSQDCINEVGQAICDKLIQLKYKTSYVINSVDSHIIINVLWNQSK